MGPGPVVVAVTMGLRQYLRNTLFVVFLVLLPPTFITLSFIVTPDASLVVSVPEGGTTLATDAGMADLHGALMVPMTVAFLAGILGMFVMLSSREADRRLVRAGYPLGRLLAVRLGIIAGMTSFITLIAVAATLIDFRPPQLGMFFLVNLIAALQYAFLGAVIGTFLSAMSGTYLMFFVPMIDVGLVQNPMFPRDSVAWWVQALPGYAPMEMLLDVSFTSTFDEGDALLISLLYLGALTALGLLAFRRAIVGLR